MIRTETGICGIRPSHVPLRNEHDLPQYQSCPSHVRNGGHERAQGQCRTSGSVLLPLTDGLGILRYAAVLPRRLDHIHGAAEGRIQVTYRL